MFNDAKNQKSKFLPQPGFELQGSQHWSKIGDFLTFIPFFRDEKNGFEIFKPDFRIRGAILPPGPENQRKNFSSSPKIVFICLIFIVKNGDSLIEKKLGSLKREKKKRKK